MYELELYKLVVEKDYVDSCCWRTDKMFLVWIPYIWLEYFVKELKEIFGNSIFDEGGFEATMLEDCICIDLADVLSGYIELEKVFPKSLYKD